MSIPELRTKVVRLVVSGCLVRRRQQPKIGQLARERDAGTPPAWIEPASRKQQQAVSVPANHSLQDGGFVGVK